VCVHRVIGDSVIRFVVGSEYYVEFTIIVVGAMNLAIVCCDMSEIQLVQVMGGN
jgi:hypothetical protein